MNKTWQMKAVSLAVVGLVLGSGARAADEEAKAPEKAEVQQESVRVAIGKLLTEARELSAAGKTAEALAKIEEADAVTEKTPYELYVLARMRGVAALSAGRLDLAAKSFVEAFETKRLTPAETQDISRSLAGAYYKAGNYARTNAWAERHFAAGGNDSQVRFLAGHAYYAQGDWKNAVPLLKGVVQDDEKAGKAPSEAALQLLGNSLLKQKDTAGLIDALEKLATHYRKADYWNDLLRRLQLSPEFAERLSLDAYRLQRVAGSLTSADEYIEMAALAIQAGFPSEARQIVDEGYTKGLLGTGPDVATHKKVRDLAYKGESDDRKTMAQEEQRTQNTKNGQVLVNFGYNLLLLGETKKGIAMIERGIALGSLKHPDDAWLRLGIAFQKDGQSEPAKKAFSQVQGKDGAATLARLWQVYGGRS